MESFDYYEILEIEKTSDKEVIKKAYRKMALKYHPDRNPNNKDAEERFKKINEAYEVLSDEEKKSLYDRYGKEGLESSGFRGFSGRDFGDIFGDIGNIFESVFGQSFNYNQNREKANLDFLIEVDLTLKESILGVKKKIKNTYNIFCESCSGTGAKDGKIDICQKCDGQGKVFVRQGFMNFTSPCTSCRGSGSSIKDKCKKCHGSGKLKENEEFDISFPEGINTGNRIRLKEHGNLGKNGKRGDLYISINVLDDDIYIRNESDIYMEVPIFFTSIVTGAEINVPAIYGDVKLVVPAGARDEQQFIFERQGAKDINSKYIGRFVVQIKIIYPRKISQEQKELANALAESFNEYGRPYEEKFKKAKFKFTKE